MSDEKQPMVCGPTHYAGCDCHEAQRNDRVTSLRSALHEIAEEWAGAECGEPVTAQEAYAIQLAQRMYRIAAEALR
jgi:hypothetical protein